MNRGHATSTVDIIIIELNATHGSNLAANEATQVKHGNGFQKGTDEMCSSASNTSRLRK